jgi:Family of unknown function (DUF6022)
METVQLCFSSERSSPKQKVKDDMKLLAEFLAEKREVNIHTLASYGRQYLQEQWELVLLEHREELLQVFEKAGEVAYGMFGRSLLQPLLEQFHQAGFLYEGANFSTSIEHWGPPEERERCMWCIVKSAAQGEPLGTLVFRIFHDHTQFRLPYPPALLTLEETATSAIIEILSRAFIRKDHVSYEGTFRPEAEASTSQQHPGWEYSIEIGLGDSLDPHRLELSEAMLDHALSLWGHYGWELASTVSHQGRLLAFFKRPLKGIS